MEKQHGSTLFLVFFICSLVLLLRLFWTYVSATMCNEPTVEKVHAFIRAAGEAEEMLKRGAGRGRIGECVSDEGKKKLWDHWPE